MLGSGGGWDSDGVSVLAGFLKMGPLPLPLDLASLITRTHLQRSVEVQIMGQKVFRSPHTRRLRKMPWFRMRLGWVGISPPSWMGPVLGFLTEEIENRDQPITCDVIIIFTIITVNNDGCYLFRVCMLQTWC